MDPEDLKLARASRLLRRRAGLRQTDLKTSRFVAQEIEAGRAAQLRLAKIRAHFSGLDSKASMGVWWHGAFLDRLLDSRHAGVVNGTVGVLRRYGFESRTEFTFNEFGERGSIDIFAGNEAFRAVFVGEAKSEWGSLEETLRRQHLKVRLAPKLAEKAFGWRPESVASVLILPDDNTNRRVAARYARALDGYPARGREIRAWLRRPNGPLQGIWFLSDAGLVGDGRSVDG